MNQYRLIMVVKGQTETHQGTYQELINKLFATRAQRIQAWMERLSG